MKDIYSSLNSQLVPKSQLLLKLYSKIRYSLNTERFWQEKSRILREERYINQMKKLDEVVKKRRAHLKIDQLERERYYVERTKFKIENRRADEEKVRADQEEERVKDEKEFADRVKRFADLMEMRAINAKEFADSVKGRADDEKERANKGKKKARRLERLLTQKLTNLVKECRYFFKRFFF